MYRSATGNAKRVAIASFEFEGNDFSLKVNGREIFVPYAIGEAIWPEIEGHELAVTGAAEVLREEGFAQLVPILVAQSQSGAKVEDGFYRETFSRLVDGIRACGPLDGVYLALHGAMVSGGVPDAEGEILAAVREVVGPAVPIAVSLDLHAHVSQQMLDAASIIVGYANYPHDDAYTTGKRAATLLRDTLAGSLDPVMRAERLSMIVPVTGSSTQSPDGPLAKVRELARSLESGGVVSTSYFTVQPWLDNDDALNVCIAITNADEALAATTARTIATRMWNLRDEFLLPLYTPERAIELSRSIAQKPVIFADEADGVGAGSAGDAALMLAALIRHASGLRSAICIADREVADLAHKSGVGAVIETMIGFRNDPRHGIPVELTAEVVSLHSGRFTYTGGPMGGVTVSMGPSAVLKCAGVHILVTSSPTYEYSGEQYVAVGIDIEQYDIVVFKNGMNFRMSLNPGSRFFLIEGVGSSSGNLANLPWKNRISEFWPRERDLENPFKN